MSKLTAWILLAIISAIEGLMLYFGVGGEIQAVLLPIVAYLFGIATKTGLDKIINNNNK